MTPRYRRTPIPSAILLILMAVTALSAQTYFGRNKVHYEPLNWKVVETTHFEVYYYQEEEAVAKLAADIAESAYVDLSRKFEFEITHRVPVILYATHTLFQETNITSEILPEGVGGFTEFLKGRVVVPFNGSRSEFRHVLKHELVHVFTLEKIRWEVDAHNKFFFGFPPLWFMEGLAEHWSTEWSTLGQGLVGNEVLHGGFNSFDDLERISGSWAMYKGGESACQWLEETYGQQAIRDLMVELPGSRNFWDLWEITTGETYEKSGERWGYWLKKQVYPQIGKLEFPEVAGEQLTLDGQSLSPTGVFNIAGTETLRGVLYKADRLGYSEILYGNLATFKRKSLIQGEMGESFESLHLFRNRMGVKDSQVVLSIKRGPRDRLIIMNIPSGDIVREREFKELHSIVSPDWNPAGEGIVFTGVGPDGLNDLYLWSPQTDSVTRLTRDPWDEQDPIYTSDGKSLIYSSDRGSPEAHIQRHLFRMDLATRQVVPLTEGPWQDTQPARFGDTLLTFVSDRDGIPQVMLRREDGAVASVTRWTSGVIDYTHDRADTLIASCFVEQSYRLVRFQLPESLIWQRQNTPAAIGQDSAWLPTLPDSSKEKLLTYHPTLSLEIAQGDLSTPDASEGTGSGLITSFSDVLGDQSIYFLLLSDQNITWGNFFDNLSVEAAYMNRQKRLGWSLGAYRYHTAYWDRIQGTIENRDAGLTGSLSYPLSRFHRFDLDGYLRYSERLTFPNDLVTPQEDRKAVLGTLNLSYIRDNSLWGITGPVDGMAMNFTVGVTTDFKSKVPISSLASADIRYYWRLARSLTWAHRVVVRYSGGPEPDRYFLGGTFSLRGYPFFEFYGRKLFLANTELRFPIIPAALIRTPLLDLQFYGVKGALFVDAGNAWEGDVDRLKGAFGFSLRVPLSGVMVFRFDWAKRTDWRTVDPSTRFDFFFGWDY